MTNDTAAASAASTSASCCCTLSRWRAEYALGWFSVEDFNGKTIDTQRTFCPRPRWIVVPLKVFFFATTLSVIVYNILTIQYSPKPFWLAWYTNWTVLVVLFYQQLSAMTVLCTQLPHPTQPTPLLKATWLTYPWAATTSLAATILYWLLVYNPEDDDKLTFLTVVKHGILSLLVLTDGLVVSYIPVRIKHLWIPFVFNLLYILWSIVHSFTDIGNPFKKGDDDYYTQDDDNDAIYKALNWNKRPVNALLYSILSNLVLFPLLAFGVWALSSLGGWYRFDASMRRYKTQDLHKSLLHSSHRTTKQRSSSSSGSSSSSSYSASSPSALV